MLRCLLHMDEFFDGSRPYSVAKNLDSLPIHLKCVARRSHFVLAGVVSFLPIKIHPLNRAIALPSFIAVKQHINSRFLLRCLLIALPPVE